MYILRYRVLYGRTPEKWDIIKIEEKQFICFKDLKKCILEKFLEKSIWWIDYEIIKDEIIIEKIDNKNLILINDNYIENR